LEGRLNRRGVFFRKLAAADIEFFEPRAAAAIGRGPALTINAPIAEAMLPRAAQRRGYWKLRGREYPAGPLEPFDLNRAVDWQLVGPAAVGEDADPVSAGDWFAVQYETAPDGDVSFLWRVATRGGERRLWQNIEDGVNRHLVNRMAHFSDVHPEFDSIDALLNGPASVEEEEVSSTELPAVPAEHSFVPSTDTEVNETTLRMSDGAILQYQYYVPRVPVTAPRPAPVPFFEEAARAAEESEAPLPAIESILNLGKTLQPILIQEIPVFSLKAPSARSQTTPSSAPPIISKRKGPRLWAASTGAVALLLLAGLSVKNGTEISVFACQSFGLYCLEKHVAKETVAVPPSPSPIADDPIQTASIPAPAPPQPLNGATTDEKAGAAAYNPDEVVWRFLKDTRNSEQLKNFLSQFPASSYRPLAEARLAALEPNLTECDLFAAHPMDQLKNPDVRGVNILSLNALLAVQACERAVTEHPEALRFPLQLGRSYEKVKRYDDAHRWYAKAAEWGDAQAMHNLGFQYATGIGANRDYVEARKWFAKAAALGNPPAMTHLGQLYANGLGSSRDYTEARHWFEQAADRGVPLAMSSLGELYEKGLGVRRDYSEARRWYQKAAQLGSASAMYNLGLLYENGYGGPRDHTEARKWFAKAADIGNDDARQSLARIKR